MKTCASILKTIPEKWTKLYRHGSHIIIIIILTQGNSIHIAYIHTFCTHSKRNCLILANCIVGRSSTWNWFQLFNLFWILCGRIHISSLHTFRRINMAWLMFTLNTERFLTWSFFIFALTYRKKKTICLVMSFMVHYS